MMMELLKAMGLLAEVTPLRTDCGRICGSACCRSLDGEETGMLLFPGEEALYEHKTDVSIRRTTAGYMLVCNGSCDRNSRPLACRMFPLLPTIRDGEIHVEVDARAHAVCPLARQGMQAMAPEFINLVKQAGRELAEDPAKAAFLMRLTREHDDLRALRRKFTGR